MLNVNISPEIFHLQNVGGISRYFSELSKICTHDIEVSGTPVFSKNLYLPGYLESSNNRLLFKIQRLFNDLYFRSFSGKIKHLTYYDYKNFSKKDTNIITVYDCIHEKLGIDSNDNKIIDLKRCCIENADKIISISNTTTEDIIDIYNVPSSKVQTIYLGVEANEEAVHDGSDMNIGHFLLFVGSRDGYKNFDMLLEAYSNTKYRQSGGKLVAFGSKASNYEKSRIQSLGLSKQEVLFLQGDDSFLSRCYQNADLHIVPSLYEGFGLTPFESIAQGCKTVVHSNKVFQELFGDSEFVFDLSVSDNIMYIIDHYDHKLIELSNREYFNNDMKKFTWDRVRHETSNLYLNV
ncbi:glycosyltransferase [Vibrio ostreicida]|uniref:glycosyltransferase n=1 Tax=Vibrio ostreicida TaxID=526588 RepID=UPI00097124C3|nr:glycosyltransferase [Vibrio ostreicida]